VFTNFVAANALVDRQEVESSVADCSNNDDAFDSITNEMGFLGIHTCNKVEEFGAAIVTIACAIPAIAADCPCLCPSPSVETNVGFIQNLKDNAQAWSREQKANGHANEQTMIDNAQNMWTNAKSNGQNMWNNAKSNGQAAAAGATKLVLGTATGGKVNEIPDTLADIAVGDVAALLNAVADRPMKAVETRVGVSEDEFKNQEKFSYFEAFETPLALSFGFAAGLGVMYLAKSLIATEKSDELNHYFKADSNV